LECDEKSQKLDRQNTKLRKHIRKLLKQEKQSKIDHQVQIEQLTKAKKERELKLKLQQQQQLQQKKKDKAWMTKLATKYANRPDIKRLQAKNLKLGKAIVKLQVEQYALEKNCDTLKEHSEELRTAINQAKTASIKSEVRNARISQQRLQVEEDRDVIEFKASSRRKLVEMETTSRDIYKQSLNRIVELVSQHHQKKNSNTSNNKDDDDLPLLIEDMKRIVEQYTTDDYERRQFFLQEEPYSDSPYSSRRSSPSASLSLSPSPLSLLPSPPFMLEEANNQSVTSITERSDFMSDDER
jgi:hypothetical protein